MVLLDRYQIISPLGSGGMGEVALANDKLMSRQVALKRLKPDMVREKDLVRFQREASLLQTASHPNVLEVYDTHFDAPQPFFTMAYCSKGDLSSVVGRTLGSAERTKAMLRELLNGLEHLHNLEPQILHRDLKPGNILIGDDGHPKLSDFGLARTIKDDTITSTNWGSQGFTAPEQFENMHGVDERADLYSIGAIGYFLYTSLVPGYFGASVRDRVLDTNLAKFIAALLNHEPTDRASSARVARLALDRLDELSKEEGFEEAFFDTCQRCRDWAIDVHYDAGHTIHHVSQCLNCPWQLDGYLSRR